ncbi:MULTISPECIES: quinone-dependent dihydroorotate dehydrogenase [unclassified Cryobacterium]|uniref:quinone-dependent dihydroorotate dehydrogenase n=1 Tax=unclassified Cryobacterium TaxID=2649013 RepID=UPI00106B1CFA|nr:MULTISPECIES: quinone-dependent dihydroorotate dehydrogenase [unclassified Cryobacterium]TFC53418.1 quinone-dependent dihydroorotate dehydrogenase [Cryobacterium sp. TMB3-1-2]TFC69083.1 quinone-dependent dihydroorotate dehydrogenase [Cryobacterium sp. TMB3-15]TFC76117.1 quinone-dependent dihydroorotate dehydrogenase [Cryobacterium sp. TMB3-10]TFD43878.1 quinone-dependent dihydroorotate dehydrogenase [Cryobacterium sp. TMB3-12]
MYPTLFKLVLTRIDPERAHHLAFEVIRWMPRLGLGPLVHRFTRPRTDIGVDTLGLHFDSPFGVAAGFDKDGHAVIGLGRLGFGHVEVGTLTAVAQPGNPTPRLFRLVSDRAVINRMGFNNGGAEAAVARLGQVRRTPSRPVLGINIGKSRVTAVEDATADYLVSTVALAPLADYLVVNVSSPNTPGLRGLQELDQLAPLLRAVQEHAGDTPLLVKIAPDLTDDEVTRIAGLTVELGLAGIIATNTTLSRENLLTDPAVVAEAGAGGLSGAPLNDRSLSVLRLIRASVPAELCVISVGGVETAQQVVERLDAGATLVQGYTGFLYRGPLWARQINRGLDTLLAGRSTGPILS